MEKIHILTDSSSDIPQGLVEQHGIEIVPIMLSHGGRTFREYYDITPAECCRLLEESDEIPSTAMATPAVFLESYNRAFERGCTHLIGVIINGSGSGTYQAACGIPSSRRSMALRISARSSPELAEPFCVFMNCDCSIRKMMSQGLTVRVLLAESVM